MIKSNKSGHFGRKYTFRPRCYGNQSCNHDLNIISPYQHITYYRFISVRAPSYRIKNWNWNLHVQLTPALTLTRAAIGY